MGTPLPVVGKELTAEYNLATFLTFSVRCECLVSRHDRSQGFLPEHVDHNLFVCHRIWSRDWISECPLEDNRTLST
ncbi:hypothetical protein M404DRAFT_791909 [Pisolithus tinctorius Marx 270]|uniref:Uncharacterized protein n=1 Tax=Pisolithus tinctorius Marx 270 TaxID=870435 RepID=A0A0C3PRD1_PISTI|nr:hypothetical protein M404DRAFT_791909 [Pisolithus tinctorius Marx 270]